MTALLLLAVAALAALLLAMAVSHRGARRQAEATEAALRARIALLETQAGVAAPEETGRAPEQREWLAVLAHELRSPLSAVLGYGELLAEGALGPVEGRAADAINRIRLAADQLLRLIEGIEELFATTHREEYTESVSASDLLRNVADALHYEAEARDTTILIDDTPVSLSTRVNDARRCVMIALTAALKISPGATLRLSAEDGTIPALILHGSNLLPDRDDPESSVDAPLTGAGLRLGIARRSARLAGGSLVLQPTPAGTVVRIFLPRLGPGGSIDGAEQTP